MKVLLLNGSPRKAGCTFTALSETASVSGNSSARYRLPFMKTAK